MSDSDSASFTVRLVNQVMAPARQIKAAMGDVDKAFKQTQRTISAPMAKRSPLDDFSKMVAKAKLSQAKDFAAQHVKAVKAAQPKEGGGFMSDLLGQLAPAALTGGAAGLVAAAVMTVMNAAKAAASAVIEVGSAFVSASVDAAKFADHATLAIGYLTNNASQAGMVFDAVRREAQGLGLDVNETVGSFQKLLAMQFDIGKSHDLVKMAADMQAIGASGEEVQRILYAISEIKSMGTLQKRQERMLQMAGISGQLIDAALMKRTGIKDIKGLEKARAKGKIGADVAVDAVMDAVMHKTHEKALGDVGRAFANSSLQGLENQFGAGLENFFITSGELIKPGLLELATLIKGTLGQLLDDPELAQFGKFMLAEFSSFVDWSRQNWPLIQQFIIEAFHEAAAAVRFVAETLDASTAKGQAFYGALQLLYAPIAMIGASVQFMADEFHALEKAIDSVLAKLKELPTGPILGGLAGFASPIPGAGLFGALLPTLPSPSNDNDSQPQGVTASGGLRALLGLGDHTEASHQTNTRSVNVGGVTIHVTAPDGQDPKSFGQKVHDELAIILRQAG